MGEEETRGVKAHTEGVRAAGKASPKVKEKSEAQELSHGAPLELRSGDPTLPYEDGFLEIDLFQVLAAGRRLKRQVESGDSQEAVASW